MFHICFIDKSAHKSLGEPNYFPRHRRCFVLRGHLNKYQLKEQSFHSPSYLRRLEYIHPIRELEWLHYSRCHVNALAHFVGLVIFSGFAPLKIVWCQRTCTNHDSSKLVRETSLRSSIASFIALPRHMRQSRWTEHYNGFKFGLGFCSQWAYLIAGTNGSWICASWFS